MIIMPHASLTMEKTGRKNRKEFKCASSQGLKVAFQTLAFGG